MAALACNNVSMILKEIINLNTIQKRLEKDYANYVMPHAINVLDQATLNVLNAAKTTS